MFLQSAVASSTSNPQPRMFQLPPQVVPSVRTTQANPSSVKWNYGREIAENFAESGERPTYSVFLFLIFIFFLLELQPIVGLYFAAL